MYRWPPNCSAAWTTDPIRPENEFWYSVRTHVTHSASESVAVTGADVVKSDLQQTGGHASAGTAAPKLKVVPRPTVVLVFNTKFAKPPLTQRRGTTGKDNEKEPETLYDFGN